METLELLRRPTKIEPTVKLPLYDMRMLQVMEYMVEEEFASTRAEFLMNIGYTRPTNLHRVKKGIESFQIFQFNNCVKHYGVNPAFFFDKTAPMF
jgi:hypothetical protein